MDRIEDDRRASLWMLGLYALAVGIVTGYGAVFFRLLITVFENLFFAGTLSLEAHENTFTPTSVWGPFVVLAPVVGGLLVVFLVRTFAPEAKGHGVPEVMDAIYYREGEIRPVVAIVKSFASAISIGSGASVGREGPIIQIGASLGSTLGRVVRIAPWQRINLVAAGAGAGIAATFNTPLGAVFFAVELMMPEVSTRTFLPVVIATGAATYIGRLHFGLEPAFAVPAVESAPLHPIDLPTLSTFIVLGLLCGVAAWAFVRLLTALERAFESSWPRRHPYLANVAGMAVLGTGMYGLWTVFGHYFINGAGYGTIQAILAGELTAVGLLMLLFVAKLAATTLSLAAGASGGVFSPSLFLGATLGGAVGALVLPWLPAAEFTAPDYAVVGMASVVGAATGAPLTAILMIFEMTRDYNIIVPLILAVSLAIGLRRLLSEENIYTVKLAWRGRRVPRDRHSNMFLIRHCVEVMSPAVTVMPAGRDLHAALEDVRSRGEPVSHIVVDDGGRLAGLVSVSQPLVGALETAGGRTLGAVADTRFVVARADDSMFDLFHRLSGTDAERAAIVRGEAAEPAPQDVAGVISKRYIAEAVLANFGSYNR